MTFKEWFQGSVATDSISKAIDTVTKGIVGLLDYNSMQEAKFSDNRDALEPLIFDGCSEFCEFVRRWVPKYAGKKLPAKCGTSGCAYFVNASHVVKLTMEQEEGIVAYMLRGSDIIPVKGVGLHKRTGCVMIMMERLDTGLSMKITVGIMNAGTLIRQFVAFQKMMVPANQLATAVSKEGMAAWLQKEGKPMTPLLEKMIEWVMAIHQKSGRLMHMDMSVPDNFGLQKTRKKDVPELDRLRMLDAGYSEPGDPKYDPTRN